MVKRYHYSANEAGWETIVQAQKIGNQTEILFLSKSDVLSAYYIGYFDTSDFCDINDRKSVLNCYIENEDNGWAEGGYDTITEANYAVQILFCDDGFQPFVEYEL